MRPLAATIAVLPLSSGCGGPTLRPWHIVELTGEFTAAKAEHLSEQSYRVIGLRAPGYGTAPFALRDATVHDMAAAVHLPMAHRSSQLGPRPIHMAGYSTGATLALPSGSTPVPR